MEAGFRSDEMPGNEDKSGDYTTTDIPYHVPYHIRECMEEWVPQCATWKISRQLGRTACEKKSERGNE